MPDSQKHQLVNPEHLIRPDDNFREGYPLLDFSEIFFFENTDDMVLITDPTYLADIYNSTDKLASFLRQHGVIVMNFGGDVSTPIWFQKPYLIIPIALDTSSENIPNDIEVLVEEIGTDSGSFIFLPITDKTPIALMEKINNVVSNKNGVFLQIPKGKWNVLYEQRGEPEEKYPTLYRNIVACLETK